jgi:outer membrane protein assembly factor BamA
MNALIKFTSLFSLLFLFSCSAKKFLPEGERYLDKISVEVSGPIHGQDKNDLEYDLEDAIQPSEIYNLLIGSRPEIWFYHKTKGDSSSIKKWMFKKLAEKPVYLSEADIPKNIKNLNLILENEGFYYSEIEVKVDTGKVGSKVFYKIKTGEPIRIDSILFNVDSSFVISKIINNQQKHARFAKGDRFMLDRLEQERARLADTLSSLGYFYFRPDYLFFEIDTSRGNRKADVFLELKQDIPEGVLNRYKTGEVLVYSNFDLNDSIPESLETNASQDSIYFIYDKKFIRNKVLNKNIHYQPGKFLSRLDHEKTLEEVSNLRVYKFINAVPERNLQDTTVNITLYLSPEVQNNLKAEVSLVTKSNNFTGPGLSISHLNKNAFKGAERLTLSLNGAFETQIGGQRNGLSSFEIGVENTLSIPGILLPFSKAWDDNVHAPYTSISANYNFQTRINQFSLTSLNGSYDVEWDNNKALFHRFSALAITFLKTSDISEEFREEINNNPILAESFRENFIPEIAYELTWNPTKNNRKPYYANINFSLAGNVSTGIASLFQNQQDDYRLFGVPISQYARLFAEARKYLYSFNNTLAIRVLGGIGYAYGNSTTLPYQKLFFSGGTNSIRAFPSRLLGPGSHEPQPTNTNLFLDQAGDLRFEANVEYRFDLNSIIEIATFVDAGNVWLLEEDPERPGGQFNIKTFADQLAVGTGLGLRLDFNYFLIRFDFAFPLRIPYRTQGDRWVVDKFAPFQGAWLRENLILNVAIGYPF